MLFQHIVLIFLEPWCPVNLFWNASRIRDLLRGQSLKLCGGYGHCKTGGERTDLIFHFLCFESTCVDTKVGLNFQSERICHTYMHLSHFLAQSSQWEVLYMLMDNLVPQQIKPLLILLFPTAAGLGDSWGSATSLSPPAAFSPGLGEDDESPPVFPFLTAERLGEMKC